MKLSSVYDIVQQGYSLVPYYAIPSGHALPVWHYFLEVTRRCNLRCKMCQYLPWLMNTPAKEQKAGELTTEEWYRVLDQVHSWGLLTFTGGEPFSRRDFVEILEYASARARTHFISNFTIINAAIADRLVECAPRKLGGRGLNVAGISLDGAAHTHNAIRGMKAGFERSTEAIRTLLEKRDAAGKQCPLIHVTTVIQDRNLGDLPAMPEIVRDIGGDILNFVTETRMHDLPGIGEVDPRSFKIDDRDYPRIDRKRLDETLEKTQRAAKQCGVTLRLPRMSRETLLDYYDGKINLDAYLCKNAWNTLVVDRLGNVYPCFIKALGNVRTDTLKDLWNSAEMRAFRKECRKGVFSPCPGCCQIEGK